MSDSNVLTTRSIHKYTMPVVNVPNQTQATSVEESQLSETIISTLSENPDKNFVSELSELILDHHQPWQIHNCKLIKLQCSKQGELPFIYHYDTLPEHLKHEYPLNGKLLANFDKKMTAKQACQLIGISNDSISTPKFVKITGTIVIFHEPLQLAIRLHWSNTQKSEDAIYSQSNHQAIQLAMQNWLFVGRIDTLYKQNQSSFAIYDEYANSLDQGQYIIPTSHGYQPVPHQFSVNLIEQLHKQQDKLDWIDESIRIRVE